MNSLKRITAIISAMSVLLAANTAILPENVTEHFTIAASAADTANSGECGAEGDNVQWTLDSHGTLTISGEGKMLDGDGLTNTPWDIFKVKKAVIEDGVTSIGAYAFNNAIYMESISIPDSVSEIGEYAFFDCQVMTEIDIPDAVKELKTSTFYDCYSLTEVTLSENIASIGYGVFQNCSKLQSITFMNPQCMINNYYTTISNSVDFEAGTAEFTGTIYGYADSTAQAYAEKHNRKFAVIGKKPSSTTTTPNTSAGLRGDVNENGTVDVEDAQLALNAYVASMAGLETNLSESQVKAADVNENNDVSVDDAQNILIYYVNNTLSGNPMSWDSILNLETSTTTTTTTKAIA